MIHAFLLFILFAGGSFIIHKKLKLLLLLYACCLWSCLACAFLHIIIVGMGSTLKSDVLLTCTLRPSALLQASWKHTVTVLAV